jgi:hypothetical protein
MRFVAFAARPGYQHIHTAAGVVEHGAEPSCGPCMRPAACLCLQECDEGHDAPEEAGEGLQRPWGLLLNHSTCKFFAIWVGEAVPRQLGVTLMLGICRAVHARTVPYVHHDGGVPFVVTTATCCFCTALASVQEVGMCC